MANNVFISVIIPAYNVENYIQECLDSISNQTFKDIEIIVIDDGSTDSTGKLCDEIARNDSRIIVKHEKNSGLVSSRKKGVSIAHGHYITFVDSDDWLEKDYYENVYNVIKKYHNIDCIVTELFVCSHTYEKKREYTNLNYGYYDFEKVRSYIIPNMMCDNYSLRQNVSPSLCIKMIRKELLIQNIQNCDDMITLGEDAAISYFVLYDCKNLYIMDYAGYNYRFTPNSMTKSSDPLYYERLQHFSNYVDVKIKEKKAYQLQQQYDLYKLYLLWRQLRVDIFTDCPSVFLSKMNSPVLLSLFKHLDITKIDCKSSLRYFFYLLKQKKYFSLRELLRLKRIKDNFLRICSRTKKRIKDCACKK